MVRVLRDDVQADGRRLVVIDTPSLIRPQVVLTREATADADVQAALALAEGRTETMRAMLAAGND